MLIEPHGGKLIRRVVPPTEKERIIRNIEETGYIGTDWDTIYELENIARGAFSPLEGFMNKEEILSVANDMLLPSGHVWSLPIIFQLKEKPNIPVNEMIGIQGPDEKLYGLIHVQDIFQIDLQHFAKKFWNTEDQAHPGVSSFYSKGEWAISGKVWLVDPPPRLFEKYQLFPDETRTIFEFRGWKNIVGFQTRNIPHRGHEYIQRIALEISDGIFINPIFGTKKAGDFSTQDIIEAYEVLIREFYPEERVLFSGLTTHMRYAGPREAVFHAIIRKNFGCSHFIVGRDHAGVGKFYDQYDAHRIFDRLPKELGIEIIRVDEVYFCHVCGLFATKKTCRHTKNVFHISMTAIRDGILLGEIPSENLIRQEMLQIVTKRIPTQLE
ncbi:MAG: sulfate adenylyltransferase [Deltaproteobacteria bacterium]|nr:sulfate adenylyltransferase [Deltaproteobacteria bacterium]